MQSLIRAAIALLAALLGASLFAFAQSSAAAGDEVAATRQDGVTLFHDDDSDDSDDDDDDDDVTTFDSGTGVSNDGTGSRVTGVTDDRDVSVDDLTKDRTLDGGDPTRDLTENHTNDSTRNDTR